MRFLCQLEATYSLTASVSLLICPPIDSKNNQEVLDEGVIGRRKPEISVVQSPLFFGLFAFFPFHHFNGHFLYLKSALE